MYMMLIILATYQNIHIRGYMLKSVCEIERQALLEEWQRSNRGTAPTVVCIRDPEFKPSN